MSISRARNAQHKVYIPSSARENHYFLIKIKVTDELVAKYADIINPSHDKPYQQFYLHLYRKFFTINNELGLENSQFIANDKFTRVRYSSEKLTIQTAQQNLFLYNPKFHYGQSTYFDGAIRAKKIALLFLANGDDIRSNAANFHNKVQQAVSNFMKAIDIPKQSVRVSDHQHLSYDLFAKEKGITSTQVHKFRSLKTRYSADNLILPDNTNSLTYAIVDLPINSRLRQLVDIDDSAENLYNPLYRLIADAFINAAKQNNLTNGAVIANALVPIVRESKTEMESSEGEFQLLSYNPSHTSDNYICKWSANRLVDTVELIIVASDKDKTTHGFGKFLNQIHQALYTVADKLEYTKNKEEIMIRFHQHIAFSGQ